MAKSDLFKEHFITIVIVLSLVFIDYVKQEWKEFKR